jgi:hypothetical protein
VPKITEKEVNLFKTGEFHILMHSVAITILARAGCVRFCRTKCPLLTAFFFPFLSSTSATFLPKGFIEEDFVKLFWQIVDKAKQKNQSCR